MASVKYSSSVPPMEMTSDGSVLMLPPTKKVAPQRQQWSKKVEFILSSLGYAVGFGNIWRFPYLVYKYGGGTFLIPFVIFVLLTGIPFMALEMTVAQYAGLGPFHIYDELCPAMKGLGVATFLTSFVNSIQYVQLLGYVIYYLFASFTTELPWNNCDNGWNLNGCIGPCGSQPDVGGKFIWLNETCLSVCPSQQLDDLTQGGLLRDSTIEYHICPVGTCTGNKCGDEDAMHCSLFGHVLNCSTGGEYPNVHSTFPTYDYFYAKVLNLYDSEGNVARWESYGTMVWPVFGCVIVAYILAGSALVRGIQTSGKVVYFTATFPYAILAVLFAYGVSLPGALDGIKFYLTPDLNKLMESEVWYEALAQVFFSLGVGYGGVMTLSSYNHFDTPVVSYAVMISTMNFLTSFFAGFIVFSVLGYIAQETNVPIDSVAGKGLSLTFISFPTALAKMAAAPVWSVLFFAMLVTVGLDTQMADMETQLTAFFDEFPTLRTRKSLVVLGVTTAGVLGAMSMSFQGGIWMMTLLNDYAATAPVLIVSLFNAVIFAYLYGVHRLFQDMETMVGPVSKFTKAYLFATWKFSGPATVFLCLMYFWGTFPGSEYDRPRSELFPGYINVLGMACTGFLFIIIPVGVLVQYYRNKDVGLRNLFKPTAEWMSQEERKARGRTSVYQAEGLLI